jgi:DNA-binding SARP family transcriptional activator
VRAIFALLLLRANQTVTMDALIDELWGDDPPATALATVRTHIYRLRSMLGHGSPSEPSSLIVTQPTGYLFRFPDEEIDANVFLKLVGRGQELLERGRVERATSTLRRALSLWRGNALADVPCGPLLEQHAAHLDESRIATLELRIRADMLLGRYRRLVAELAGLVAAHPLNESLHASYIEALHRSGRRGEALQAFSSVQSVLQEELGLDPSPELQRLQRRILRGEALPDRAAMARSSAG